MLKTAEAAITTPDDARARIIAAARRQFAATGFVGASTRQIAGEAGVAQSLLLYHFGSKDALWRAVMEDLSARLGARIGQAVAEVGEAPIAARLMAIVTAFVGFCAEDADLHRIMTAEGHHQTDRLTWLAQRYLRENHDLTCALIRAGQAAGVVRSGDPTLLYYTVIAIAGTTFSLAPEIRLVSQNAKAVDPAAITALIRSIIIVGEPAAPV